MDEIILRDYQKSQINFIEERIDIADIVGIESPTGSGKTIVMLEYIKQWLSKPENQLSNVVISTGFNNLVFLLEQKSKEMGLDSKILIGTKACNCPVMLEDLHAEETTIFTLSDKYRCGEKHKHLDTSTDKWSQKVCPFTQAMYKEHFQSIVNGVGQVIITNHSSLLIHQESLKNCGLLIIDEAHTFSIFYDSYLKLELDKADLIEIDKKINTIANPMKAIIKMNMQRGVTLPNAQIDKICATIDDSVLRSNTRKFFETKADYSNYIERTPFSFTVDKFYRSFELTIHPKIILFSATLDEFTLDMFNVRKSNFYKEYKTFCDYKQSEFIAIPNDDYLTSLKMFLEYVSGKGLCSGLILSTTIVDMKIALKNCDGYNGYKMFTTIKEFEAYEVSITSKKILVGSRALFQGIDIQGLDFVCLNKIPFPTWDDKMRAQQDFLTNNGKNNFDPWNQFTIPKTENDVIQSTGRLWRQIESKGVISIFDPRVEKFRYIIRHTMDRYRHGIVTNIMDDEGNVNHFDIKGQQ